MSFNCTEFYSLMLCTLNTSTIPSDIHTYQFITHRKYCCHSRFLWCQTRHVHATSVVLPVLLHANMIHNCHSQFTTFSSQGQKYAIRLFHDNNTCLLGIKIMETLGPMAWQVMVRRITSNGRTSVKLFNACCKLQVKFSILFIHSLNRYFYFLLHLRVCWC